MTQLRLLTGSVVGLCGALAVTLSGCTTFHSCDVDAIPVNRLPPAYRARSREEMQNISMVRLRQTPPAVYQLAPGDILGVHVENITGEKRTTPIVHFPEDGSQPPAVGMPVPVHEDGTIMLPLLKPLNVEGRTLVQATDEIRRMYTANGVLIDGEGQFIVTLMQRRKHRILVVREESGGIDGVSKRGTGYAIDLPAYENDLLHALNETGGLPGVDAKNEVLIYRGGFSDGVERDSLIAAMNNSCDTCMNGMPLPDDKNVVTIPLRFYPEQLPHFTEEDIILETGDVVVIETRDQEKFYTGGALRGGEHELPRDYDLDVLQAITVANGSVGNGTALGLRGSGNSGGRQGAGLAPSRAIVIRQISDRGQIPIRIDLKRALTDQSQRLLLQPKDTIVVQYTLFEEIYNTAISIFNFNYLLNSGGNGF